MIVFNADLDNTLIYSYKHKIGNEKKDVELYNGRNISFASKKTLRLLREIKKEILIVPTTTRTIEQYKRINLDIGKLQYALVCNGGILLKNGEVEQEWYQDSLKLISESNQVIEDGISFLRNDLRRDFEVRHIENLFVFTKCREPEEVVVELKRKLDLSFVDVFNNGIKVYIVPKTLTKGAAIKRFKEYIDAGIVIAAGDSEFDLTMFDVADVSYAPMELKDRISNTQKIHIAETEELFSEFLLKSINDKLIKREI